MSEWVNVPNGVQRRGAMQGCLCTEQWTVVPEHPMQVHRKARYAYALLVNISCPFHGKGWKFVVEDGCPRWERVPDAP